MLVKSVVGIVIKLIYLVVNCDGNCYNDQDGVEEEI